MSLLQSIIKYLKILHQFINKIVGKKMFSTINNKSIQF